MQTGTSTPTVAVTGATGGIGGRVARRLASRGVGQRLVVRDPDRAPRLPDAQVLQASYGDGEAMRRALDGISTLLLVSASEARDRVAEHTTAVDAAVAAGVQRVVYISFLRAAADSTFTFARHHWHTEQHINGTGLAATFLRDSLYQDVLPYFAASDGVLRGPAGDGRVAAVARDDVADVAVEVLLGAGHDGRSYDLTGPLAFTLTDVAELLSEAAGRPVVYVPETVDEAYASRGSYGAPDWEVEGWVTSYTAVAAGDLDVVTDDVTELSGHPPMGFGEYLKRYPESMAHLAQS